MDITNRTIFIAGGTSGTGFLPFPITPTYAASKAAVHAYSEALSAQQRG